MNERNDFEVNGKKFKVSKIDALKQFHIVRRLGPILSDIIPLAKKFKDNAPKAMKGELSEAEMFADITALAQPIMNGLSKLKDEDAELVLLGLCSAVEIHQPETNNWMPLSDGKQFRYQLLEFPELIQCAGRAFAFNLSGFFASARQSS